MAWTARENGFDTTWSGRAWSLRLDGATPGLFCEDPVMGPVLGLEGLAERKRFAPRALCGATLVDVETAAQRIIATYRPLGWGALQVRAAWSKSEDDAVDLEVEVQARTVDVLHALEVKLLSTLEGPTRAGGHRSVTPRDAHAAALSYDGREHDLAGLTTGPPGEPLGPWLAPRSAWSGMTYVEFAHPDDVSRRIHEGKLPFATTRYGVFGHDLEKGVVLRARLRGMWLPKHSAMTEAERRWQEFLGAPLPLTR